MNNRQLRMRQIFRAMGCFRRDRSGQVAVGVRGQSRVRWLSGFGEEPADEHVAWECQESPRPGHSHSSA